MRQAEARSRRADSLGDIKEWMARRWAALERRGHEAEAAGRETTPTETARIILTEPETLEEIEAVEAGAGPDGGAPEPMDLGLRFQAARPGDSISRLVGSSDPRAIGKFLSLNGMDSRSSTLRSGRSYVVPTRWDDATGSETRIGQALLGADNTRLQRLAERRAELARQGELFSQGRNIWTGEPVDVGPVAPRNQLFPDLVRRRGRFDDSPTAKAVAGTLGWVLGLAPGMVRGGVNTVKGAGEGAYFIHRLRDPYDAMRSSPGQSAREQLVGAGRRLGDYAQRAVNDPSVVRDDIASAAHDFRLKQDPFASPVADTPLGEFNRTFDVAENNGELVSDVGSLFVGGGALRGAAGLGKAAKAANPQELAFLAANPGLAARWSEPYRGISHHIYGRNEPVPDWLGGGPAPQWLIESEFNKIRHKGMTTRDVYRNHFGVDDYYFGGKVGAQYGGTRWSGARDLGWTRYGPLDRLNYGTSPHTKAAVGPILFGGTVIDGIDGEGR